MVTPYVHYTTRSLFGIQDLYDLEPTQRFEDIFSTLNMEFLLHKTPKRRFMEHLQI
jgi:hypothetical protein